MRVFRLSFFYKIVRYFVYLTGNGVKQMNSEIQAVISICLWMLMLSLSAAVSISIILVAAITAYYW